jgi:hypothetical protein
MPVLTPANNPPVDLSNVLCRSQLHEPGPADWTTGTLDPSAYELLLHDVLLQREGIARGEPPRIRPIFLFSTQGAYINPMDTYRDSQSCVLLNSVMMVYNPETGCPSLQHGHTVAKFFRTPQPSSTAAWNLEVPRVTGSELQAFLPHLSGSPPVAPDNDLTLPQVDHGANIAATMISSPTDDQDPVPDHDHNRDRDLTANPAVPTNNILRFLESGARRLRIETADHATMAAAETLTEFRQAGSTVPAKRRYTASVEEVKQDDDRSDTSSSTDTTESNMSDNACFYGWINANHQDSWPPSSTEGTDGTRTESTQEISPFNAPLFPLSPSAIPAPVLASNYPLTPVLTRANPTRIFKDITNTDENPPDEADGPPIRQSPPSDEGDDDDMPDLTEVSPTSTDYSIDTIDLAYSPPHDSTSHESPVRPTGSPLINAEMRAIQDRFIMDPLQDANILSFQEIWRDMKRDSQAKEQVWNRKLQNLPYNERFKFPELDHDDVKDEPEPPAPPGTPIIREDSYALASRSEQKQMRQTFGRWKDRVTSLGHIRAAIVHGISRIKRIASTRMMEDELDPTMLNTPLYPFLEVPGYINPLLLAHKACYLEHAALLFRYQDSFEAADCIETTARMQFDDGICIRRMLASGFLEAFTLQKSVVNARV